MSDDGPVCHTLSHSHWQLNLCPPLLNVVDKVYGLEHTLPLYADDSLLLLHI